MASVRTAFPLPAPGGPVGWRGTRGRVPETDSLERNLREADAAVERDDRERYAELVQEFHDLLMVGSDNSKLRPTTGS
ncbi:FCD domain-containing protein [Streptomyces guryensis]|uniref:FCD domain-containing protein n=1 Tax=Streptomyces guryensis TaxID=2886947 RepID=UPI0027E0048C|nr:FCD domain-containing protein [Streptomyces guryensis]